MSTLFDRGDIVRVNLNPTVGKEQQGNARPALVISHKAFNALGVTMIIPVTQGGDFARYAGFAVTLMGSGAETQGVLIANMMRSVNLQARKATLIEKVDPAIVDEVVAKLLPIIERS